MVSLRNRKRRSNRTRALNPPIGLTQVNSFLPVRKQGLFLDFTWMPFTELSSFFFFWRKHILRRRKVILPIWGITVKAIDQRSPPSIENENVDSFPRRVCVCFLHGPDLDFFLSCYVLQSEVDWYSNNIITEITGSDTWLRTFNL